MKYLIYVKAGNAGVTGVFETSPIPSFVIILGNWLDGLYQSLGQKVEIVGVEKFVEDGQDQALEFWQTWGPKRNIHISE